MKILRFNKNSLPSGDDKAIVRMEAMTPEEQMRPSDYRILSEFMTMKRVNASFLKHFKDGEIDVNNENIRDNFIELLAEKVLVDIERQKSEHEAQIETLAQLSEAHRKQFIDHLEKVKTDLAEQEAIVRLIKEKQEDFHVAQEK